MAILKKPSQPAPQQQAPGRPAPGKAAPKTDPFAAKYAETEAQQGSGWVPPPPGSYNALVIEGQGVIDEQKTSAYLEVIITDDGAVEGKSARLYWNFTDENGEDQGGLAFFKSAMHQFGYTQDFTSWDEMCEALAAIAQDETWIVIDVKKKGKYTNIYLSSVPEDQAGKPANPNS